MDIKLLSLDTSTTSTGFALYINGKLTEYGKLTDSTSKSSERMANMIKMVFKKIDEYCPDIIVTELTAVIRNPKVQRELTMLLGAIYGKCVFENIDYYSFRPTEWRKLADSEKKPRKREELKQWSIDLVNKIFNAELDSDDISDAILIGMAYINMFN